MCTNTEKKTSKNSNLIEIHTNGHWQLLIYLGYMLYVLIDMTLKKLELLSSNLNYATNVCALIKKKTSNNLNLIEIHTNINELLSHVLLVGQYDGGS